MSDFKNIEELEKRLWSAADQLRANIFSLCSTKLTFLSTL